MSTQEERTDKGYLLLANINAYTILLVQGNTDVIPLLVNMLMPLVPLAHQEIPMSYEVLAPLSARERTAVEYIHGQCFKFNEKFGINTIIPSKIIRNNMYTKNFFIAVGKATQGIIDPDGECGDCVVDHMIEASISYSKLLDSVISEINAL